jgi:cob(I)alamin adenosyltransferase
MDKKQKKRLDVINKKLQTLRPRLAGSKEQADDPEELKALEDEIAALEAESKEIKASK